MSDVPRPGIRFGATVIDTPDPRGLARFYADLLGWSVDPDDCSDEWVTVVSDVGAELCFQLAIAYRPPTWPDATIPQQYHLDLMVDDLDAAQSVAESLGAVRQHSGAEGQSFRVFLDPTGHPFCLCQSAHRPGSTTLGT